MTSFIAAVHVVVGAAVLNVAIAAANAQSLQPAVLPAPIGHAQPHEPDLAPHSQADDDEQKRLSDFDAAQRNRDESLDKKLNICRC